MYEVSTCNNAPKQTKVNNQYSICIALTPPMPPYNIDQREKTPSLQCTLSTFDARCCAPARIHKPPRNLCTKKTARMPIRTVIRHSRTEETGPLPFHRC